MMKVRNFLLVIILSSLLVTSTSCGLKYEIDKEINSEIEREIPKEDIEGLGISQVAELEQGEVFDLSASKFDGEIYIMSDRTNIEKMKKSTFTINGEDADDITEGTDDDFNIRFQNKTFFSIKKLDVKSIESVKIQSNYLKKIVVVFRDRG